VIRRQRVASTFRQLFGAEAAIRPAPGNRKGPVTRAFAVGARGFEPLTSSASRKRSPPELSARGDIVSGLEAGTGIEPVCEALQASA
jgi:hypothetical protein